jgi:hypothetical protein
MQAVTVTMPLTLTGEMLAAVREDPTTKVEDREAWHTRLGWLICAWDVLVAHRLPPKQFGERAQFVEEVRQIVLTTPDGTTAAERIADLVW